METKNKIEARETTNGVITVGIVGTGNIASAYVEDLKASPDVKIAGVTDTDLEKATLFANKHGVTIYDNLEAMLHDDKVDLIVNLTIHHAHYAVNKACLSAGKHVFSEKPLALNYEEAKELADLAKARGVRLGVAPFSFLYDIQQTAWQHILNGALGEIRLAYAEVNWGRMETWHPNPAPYYDVGPLADVGVYPLTFLTAVFGPVKHVTSYGKVLKSDRATMEGEPFSLTKPDFLVCMLEHSSGVLTRLTANFYVTHSSKQESGIEIHGDKASLFLSNWLWTNGTVEVAEFDQPYKTIFEKEGHEQAHWGKGVLDMVAGILENKPHHTSGEHAAHIVEVLEAAHRSAANGEVVAVTSIFEPL